MKLIDLVFWSGSLLIGIALFILLTNLILQRRENAPTLTTIDTYYYPIYEVPFPAITFCNVNVAHRRSLQSIMDKL